jgi:phosphate acetyltransferase
LIKRPIEQVQSLKLEKKPIIALGEAEDERIVQGALGAIELGIADIILVGNSVRINDRLSNFPTAPDGTLDILDPTDAAVTGKLAKLFFDKRKHRGVSEQDAHTAVQDPLLFATLLVEAGHAHGTVNGAVYTTPDVVRAAIQVIGTHQDASMISSCFLMYLPDGRAMVYSDCGLVIDPSEQELVQIALASAGSSTQLLGQVPKIAMLSFSTKGSARHYKVTKVVTATQILNTQYPHLNVDGELQFDAAIVPEIGKRKAPESTVAGDANVMIFPNLDAGNIAYKITERLGRATALGPILQGLAKPANDLSRGCSASDVTDMIAVTILQGLHT